MTITQTLINLLFSFLASATFWLILNVAFGIKKNIVISAIFLTLVIFGLTVVFDITSGLTHIWQVAWVALLNQSFNVFTLGAILALGGILSMIVSAGYVLFIEAVE